MFGKTTTASGKPLTVLVVAPAWLGDTVMIQPMLAEIVKQGAIIDVLAPAATVAVLSRMPEVRQTIQLPVGHGQFHWSVRRALAKQLQQQQYDVAYILPNSWKSALIPWLAKIPVRIGWRGEWRYGLLSDVRLLNKQRYPLMVERFLALAYPARVSLPETRAIPRLVTTPAKQNEILTKLELSLDKPALALCPGAEYGPAKQWPASHFASVARHYLALGWQVWLLGGPKDVAITTTIAEGSGGACHNLAGKTSLTEVVDVLAQAQAVVTNDSGLMHVAAALGRPLVAVYGSSAPSFTPPLTSHAVVLQPKNLSCSPCFERTCRFGHYQCLISTEAKQVIQALDSLLEPHTCPV